MRPPRFRSVVLGTGTGLPCKVLSNADLEKMVETSDEWITARTGIKERRILEEGKGNAHMAYQASIRALEDAGMEARDLEAIIMGTVTPDYPFPSSACVLESMLGTKRAFSFDVSAACSGFINALAVADAFIQKGTIRNALVLGSDVLSRLLNWQDRGTCILFGDGAGAMILGASSDGQRGVLSTRLRTDGSFVKTLYVPAGGSLKPACLQSVKDNEHTIIMNGKEVFKVAVRSMEEISREALDDAGVSLDEISLIIPHQANLRIITALAERVGIPMSKIMVNLDKYGNTSAASVPVALDEARRQGRVGPGDVVLLNAFGAGFAWGAAVIRL